MDDRAADINQKLQNEKRLLALRNIHVYSWAHKVSADVILWLNLSVL